jgi:hypothetical protein
MLGQGIHEYSEYIQVDDLDCDSEDGVAYGKNRMASATMGLGGGNNSNGSSSYGRGAVKKAKAGRSRDRPVSMNLANLPRNMG